MSTFKYRKAAQIIVPSEAHDNDGLTDAEGCSCADCNILMKFVYF